MLNPTSKLRAADLAGPSPLMSAEHFDGMGSVQHILHGHIVDRDTELRGESSFLKGSFYGSRKRIVVGATRPRRRCERDLARRHTLRMNTSPILAKVLSDRPADYIRSASSMPSTLMFIQRPVDRPRHSCSSKDRWTVMVVVVGVANALLSIRILIHESCAR